MKNYIMLKRGKSISNEKEKEKYNKEVIANENVNLTLNKIKLINITLKNICENIPTV